MGILILVLFLFYIAPGIAPADNADNIDYEKILEKSAKINPDLKTFKSTLKIRANFMGLSMPFYGRLYYKKPDKLRLSIPMAPALLKNRKSLFSDSVPRSFSSKDYNGKIIRSELLMEKVPCYVVQLIPKTKGKIKKAYLWIDKESCLAHKTKLIYENGSRIISLQTYCEEDGYILPSRQSINFNFPKFQASANIEYQKYEVNVPVDEYLSGTDKEEGK